MIYCQDKGHIKTVGKVEVNNDKTKNRSETEEFSRGDKTAQNFGIRMPKSETIIDAIWTAWLALVLKKEKK